MPHSVITQLRQYRTKSENLVRGNGVQTKETGLAVILIFAMCAFIFCGVAWGIYTQSGAQALTGAFYGALFVFLGYALAIPSCWLWALLRDRQWPSADFFIYAFSPAQKHLCLFIMAWGMVFAVNHAYPTVSTYAKSVWQGEQVDKPLTPKTISEKRQNASAQSEKPKTQHKVKGKVAVKEDRLPIQSHFLWGLTWLGTYFLLSCLVGSLQRWRIRRDQKRTATDTKQQPFSLWLGHSSGILAHIAHGAGLAPNQNIALNLEDAAQNIVVLGGIGSGKTTRAIHPFLMQLLDQGCGGLIFDIKGDFQHAVLVFAQITARTVVRLGPGFEKINLIAGLTPEMASSFLKSAFMLSGKGHGDPFWIDTATELCRNTLGILSFLPEHYSLQGLYAYLFDKQHQLNIDAALDELLVTLDEKNEKDSRLLKSYWHYHEHIFDRFDEKVKAGVNATIAQVLSPFNHPDLVEAFCSVGEEHVPMEAVLNGTVYLLSLPLSIWGLGGKVVYSLIKLRFYNVMQQRTNQAHWNQHCPVFFMCDEFQEVISASKDGLSDLNFWDKSRSSKTIGIISAQAISSFYAAIGDRDIAHALLQNFRQKICFRTEDTTTLTYFHHLADKVEVKRRTYSHTSGTQSNPGRFLDSKSSSTTENITLVEKAVLSPQLFRNLQPNQAVALLSIHGHSMDDVIWMMPVFV